MKTGSVFKLAIVCFIIYAIYNGNSGTIKGWASKVSNSIAGFKAASAQQKNKKEETAINSTTLPVMATTSKATQQTPSSMVSNITATIITQILDNPNGRKIFEAALAKSLQQNAQVANDLKTSHHQTIVRDISLETGQDIKCTCVAGL